MLYRLRWLMIWLESRKARCPRCCGTLEEEDGWHAHLYCRCGYSELQNMAVEAEEARSPLSGDRA